MPDRLPWGTARDRGWNWAHRHEPGTAEALCGAALMSLDHSRRPRGVEVVCAACELLVMIRDSAAAGSAPESGART